MRESKKGKKGVEFKEKQERKQRTQIKSTVETTVPEENNFFLNFLAVMAKIGGDALPKPVFDLNKAYLRK
jgi:hypothetical protein